MVLKSDDTEHLMVIRADWEGFFHLWKLTDDYDWIHLTQTYPAGQGYKILRFPSVILGFIFFKTSTLAGGLCEDQIWHTYVFD